MPTDIRKLIFSQKELRVGFQTYAREHKLGAGAPLEFCTVIEPEKDTRPDSIAQELRVILNFIKIDGNKALQVSISKEHALVVLLGICKEYAVPIPRGPQKFLKKHDNGISLTLGMTEAEIIKKHMSESESIKNNLS